MHPLVVALLTIPLLVRPARALPDLTPEIYDVAVETGQTVDPGDVADGCAGSTSGLTLVRFGVRSWNVGPDPLVIGDIGCPDCTTSAGAVCANPEFMCSLSGTPRPVFQSSARYELLDVQGNVVARGNKRNYCFLDDCVPADQRTFGDCATNQGVSAGCFDDYEPDLACQYIDATDVPGITTRAFRIRVTLDPLNLLPDANRNNNVSEAPIAGCGDGIVDQTEDCDPAGTCCDATCHFVTAGTTCRPAAGPCDVAETCDGTSAACPADATAPDGTTCGRGVPPCADQVCRGGTCATEGHDGAGCVIDNACFDDGAVDPSDGCQRCDTGTATDAWSPNHDPSPAGVACQVGRVASAASGLTCSGHTAATVRRRLGRAEHMAARLGTARPRAARALERRLLRSADRLSQILGGAGGSCTPAAALGELGVLEGQLQAMVGAAR